jgi:putative acetyltransferase
VDEDDEPLAFADLEMDGHIDHLFCRPDAAGKASLRSSTTAWKRRLEKRA